MTQVAQSAAKSDWLTQAFRVLGHRKTASMIALGFASGLPFALLTGTINAWFSDAKVDLATIGVLSWIGLAYAFKFLWSPAVNTLPLPNFGRRRGWMFLCQGVITLAILVIGSQEPGTGLGVMAVAAAVGAFASATQDMSIDTWRLEVADEATPLDLLSAVYQFGYRIAAFVGGAGALLLAERMPWNTVFAAAGGVMALAMLGTLAAPEPLVRTVPQQAQSASHTPVLRAYAVGAVLSAWAWAAIVLVWFMVAAIMATTPPDAKGFTAFYGPIIVAATVILPCAISAWIAYRKDGRDLALPVPGFLTGLSQRFYGVIVEPFVELMARLGWGAVLVLIVILSYRITDSIWGPFAYPFYLGELHYTKDEVAVASKMIGVLMLIIGVVLAAWSMATFGRMFSMLIGAITAAVTNLLYVDLATGSQNINAFLNTTGIGPFFESMPTTGDWHISDRFLWLVTAIAGENIAAGFAGAVFVAYVSSLANKLHGAVQFAVFTSLTMLIGTLGRGALGEMIKTDGYASVFMFTMWIGGIAVVACLLEWVRQARMEKRA